ncbi:DUF4832 domain-containing protein [Nonomuraea pusilla]|uniref:DUF4832 domain-containing protein n=1 Tax=Nonomuraea pusilla TaxID=46177 RepID=UPI003331A04E
MPSSRAHDGSAPARLGHHDDCFLAGPDDHGTYENAAVEYPYLRSDTAYMAGRPEYSIRLADQAATGMNDLLRTVTVNRWVL